MMRTYIFAKRNFKEIVRDFITLFFCILFPLFLLVIFQQFDIPSEVYSINNFGPGIIIFSFGFICLFTSQLISRDRTTSLLTRLYASPLKPREYLLGYSLSVLPILIVQIIVFVVAAMLMGLNLHLNIFLTILLVLPISLLYISLGLIIGCLFNEKQTPAFSSIIIQLIAFTSGMWFDVNTMASGFKVVCDVLPFRYTIDLARTIINGGSIDVKGIIILSAYVIICFIVSVLLFKRSMIKDNK